MFHHDRTATITAMEPCKTIVLRRRQFEKLRELHPQVDTVLLACLAAQVNRLSEHLLEVLFSPAPRRVYRRLLSLDREFGGEPIVITQEDLALMAGTTARRSTRSSASWSGRARSGSGGGGSRSSTGPPSPSRALVLPNSVTLRVIVVGRLGQRLSRLVVPARRYVRPNEETEALPSAYRLLP